MPRRSKLLRHILLAIFLLASPQLVRAHGLVDTNVVLDIELKESLITCEPWLPTFLLPPLEDVTTENQTEWPTADERRKQIEDFYHEKCPVVVDGKLVRPEMQSLKLVPMKGAKHLTETIDFVHARVLLHYNCDAPPEKVKFTWGVFVNEPEGGWDTLPKTDHDPQEIDIFVFVDGKEDYLYFSPLEPVFMWHRKKEGVEKLNVISKIVKRAEAVSAEPAEKERSKYPLSAIAVGLAGIVFFVGTTVAKVAREIRFGGLLLALIASGGLTLFWAKQGAATPSEQSGGGLTREEAVQVFEALQANLYAAFDYEDEDKIYDVLAQSVNGALLDDIYTEVYRSLIVTDQGSSAVCRVQKVEVLECKAEPVEGDESAADTNTATDYEIRCHWRVHGFVSHNQHTHRRVNEYRADFQLAKEEDGWKIIGISVDQQQRLDPKTMKPSDDFQ